MYHYKLRKEKYTTNEVYVIFINFCFVQYEIYGNTKHENKNAQRLKLTLK